MMFSSVRKPPPPTRQRELSRPRGSDTATLGGPAPRQLTVAPLEPFHPDRRDLSTVARVELRNPCPLETQSES